jgi:hypothetical protein
VLCTLAVTAAWGVPVAAHASDLVSTNWAGYVALPHRGRAFSSVAGTWIVPRASCTAGRQTYSAMWVGLGGSRERARSLEQVGTEADCRSSGRAGYAAWFEILPAAPTRVGVRVSPGDAVSASTTVTGHGVTLRIRDLTTGARFATTRHVSQLDASSADWIVEAPSVCSRWRGCVALPLADFGTAVFDGATARAAGRTAAAGAVAWSTVALELEQESLGRPAVDAAAASGPTRTLTTAMPSMTTPASGAFTVSWSERTRALPLPPVPTLPGLGAPR